MFKLNAFVQFYMYLISLGVRRLSFSVIIMFNCKMYSADNRY